MNCPHCQRLLYSRLHAACGWCGQPLPKEYRLSDAEIAAWEQEKAEMNARRAAAKAREEEEHQRAQQQAAASFIPISMG